MSEIEFAAIVIVTLLLVFYVPIKYLIPLGIGVGIGCVMLGQKTRSERSTIGGKKQSQSVCNCLEDDCKLCTIGIFGEDICDLSEKSILGGGSTTVIPILEEKLKDLKSGEVTDNFIGVSSIFPKSPDVDLAKIKITKEGIMQSSPFGKARAVLFKHLTSFIRRSGWYQRKKEGSADPANDSMDKPSKKKPSDKPVRVDPADDPAHTMNLTITDLTSNIGANAVFLGQKFKKVNAIEKDKKLADVAKHNIGLYGLTNVKVINADPADALKKTKQDIIYFDPPWVIEEGKHNEPMDVSFMGKDVGDLVLSFEGQAKIVVMKLPHNIDADALKEKITSKGFKFFITSARGYKYAYVSLKPKE